MIEKLSAKAMQGGSVTAVVSGGAKYFGLGSAEWTLVFAAIGAFAALGGFVISWYYKHRNLQIALAQMKTRE